MKKVNSDTVIISGDYRIDKLDLQILALLIEDANRPYTDIAQTLIVSNGTVHVRMKKLYEMGVVTGSHIVVDVRKLGLDIVAFVGVILEKALGAYDAVQSLKTIPEVVEVHYITGKYSLLAKVICHDSAHFLHVLKDQIQAINGVGRTETFILLEEGFRRPVQISNSHH